jgi:hypothetical protein
MTPDQIAAQRKVADALMAQGTDSSPLPVGTRGAGEWTQGLARVAKGVAAGLDYRDADNAAKANDADNKRMIQGVVDAFNGRSATPATAPATVPTVAPVAAAAPSPGPGLGPNDPSGDTIPSPLDPPSGADRDNMIRTVYGEAGNEPAQGQLGVAAVIRNRAVDGGYGGSTPTAVVQAPNQFEPWNTPEGRARMAALPSFGPKYAAIGKVVDAAYGTGGRAPEDPTEGKTMFYSPGAQAALGRPPPAWAKGPGQVIGGHTFYDDADDAIPAAATPTQGAAPAAAPAPAVAKVTGALNGVSPAVLQAATSPYADDTTKHIAGILLAAQLGKEKKDTYSQRTDADGNIWSVNNATGQQTVAKAADKDPASVQEYEYYKKNPTPGQPVMDYQTWASKKARDAATNVSTNVDMNSGQTYDKQLAEGLAKSHAALANGVEDAQSRARDIAAMQGAVDAIQKNGGTTGGMLPAQRLELQKSINAGAAAIGLDKPFSEDDISDKEFLTKFNRSMAGAQAKGAVGSRVTNFELSNYLKANPGLEMSITGNQRLLGIQGQIEQRNIAVGQAIRDATASAISTGKRIDPVTVQGIITDYDKAHHIQDPVTGQDLTQSYALPEFQQGGTNPALAAGHAANVGKIRRYNPATGALE